jgi:hypothetical protein
MREKYGDALRVETTFGLEDVPVPDGVNVHREFDLVPRPKGKGGEPVLRLRTGEVVYMGEAQSATKAGRTVSKGKRSGPRLMAEKRAELEKRRQVRAIELFRGSMLARKVEVGTAKHPEALTPPEPQVPALLDLVALALVYGTGPAIEPAHGIVDAVEQDGDDLAAVLTTVHKKGDQADLATRLRLWLRLREPIAKSLRMHGPTSPAGVDRLVSQVRVIGALCGLKWEDDFLKSATAGLPEPRAWRSAKRAVRRAG